MHINEIRYLSDADLREVFTECVKHLNNRNIPLPLSLDDIRTYINTLDNIEAIEVEDMSLNRQRHLKATYLTDMKTYREFRQLPGMSIEIGDLYTIEQFKSIVNEGGICRSDGYGVWAYEDKVSELEYEFYADDEWLILEDYKFTHILWFNK